MTLQRKPAGAFGCVNRGAERSAVARSKSIFDKFQHIPWVALADPRVIFLNRYAISCAGFSA